MSGLAQDVRFAFRTLRKTPAFTALTVAVLALGIGANTAIFSLVDAALFRPLPFPDPDRLVMLWERAPAYAHNRVAPLNYVDWSDQNQVFSSMAAVSGGGRTLTIGGREPERIPGQSVTAAFFDVLGVRALMGRTFTAADAVMKPTTVVISERLWKRRFAGDRGMVGRTIALDSEPFTVIGVVPASFEILFPADLWTPYLPRRTPEQRRMHYMQVLARLEPDVTLDRARANMEDVARRIAVASPATNARWSVTIEPLEQALVGGDLHATSIALAAIVVLVLVTVCANVANLLLARGVGRTREIAVRAALGGGRGRIVRQLLTESVLLAAAGGAGGWAVALGLVRAAPAVMPPGTLPQGIALTMDARLALFGAAISIAAALLFGLAPAWHASRIEIAAALTAGGRSATGSATSFRAALAAVEVGIAVVLVSGATLLVRTVTSLGRVDPGYTAPNVLTMYVSPPLTRYATPERALQFYEGAKRAIAALPGVRAVAIGGSLPLDGWDIGQGFQIVGDPPVDKSSQPSAHYQIVGAEYFAVLGIPILRGRAFADRDTAAAPPVCIVNEEFVRRYFANRNPIGARVSVSAMDPAGPRAVEREVVGVSRQVRVEGLGEKQETVEIYVPVAQNPWYSAAIAVKTADDPRALAPAIRAAVARVDPELPITRLRTMDDVAAESIAEPRFRAELVGLFALLALALAAAGVFGVLVFGVNQRLREFGIRLALGARPGDVVRLVAASALRIVAAGVAAGTIAAAALGRFLGALLFGVGALDPVALAAPAALLLGVALIACAAPALRAIRVDPAASLRVE